MNTSVGDKSAEYDPKIRMASKTFYEYIKTVLRKCDMASNHYEHFGRHYLPGILEMLGVPPDFIKMLGGWERKVYNKLYSANIPLLAFLGAAWHSLDKGCHFVPRAMIDPPDKLLKKVFPFIEVATAQLRAHPKGHKRAQRLGPKINTFRIAMGKNDSRRRSG